MSYTKAILKGKEIFIVTGVWGRGAAILWEGTDKKDRSLKPKIRDDGGEMHRQFNTEGEAQAYIQGIEDMDGWMGYAFTDPMDHKKVFGTLNGLTILS